MRGLVRQRTLCEASGCAGPYVADVHGVHLGLKHQWSVSRYIHICLLFVPGVTIQWLVKMKNKGSVMSK